MRELLTSPATLRVLFYLIAPLLGMVPGITVDQAAHTILINIDTALAGIGIGAAAGAGVFAMFGKK